MHTHRKNHVTGHILLFSHQLKVPATNIVANRIQYKIDFKYK